MKNKCLVSFGVIVRQERENLALSQEAFADRCGLHRTYIGGVERGERNLGLLNLIRIAAALKMPLSSLLARLDKELQ